MTIFSDIADLEEDDRITAIGNHAFARKPSSAEKPVVVGVIVDDSEKADRYVKKLKEKFPTIRIIDRNPGPVAATVLIRVGPPLV